MFTRSIRRLFVLGMLSSVAISRANSADLQHLLTYLPTDSNALLIINAEKIFASEFAKQIGWKQEYEVAYASSPLLIPPDSKTFVMGAHMDYEFFHPLWEVAIAELADPPTLEDVEKKTRGTADTIADYKAIKTLRDSYVVRFAGDVFGIRKPASRQVVSRWLKDIRIRQAVGLSSYLHEQAKFAEQGNSEIILAFDLHDIIPPATIATAMRGSDALKSAGVDPQQAAEILASARGLTLGITVTDQIYAAIKIDCDKDTSLLSSAAKPLLMEIFGEAGAMLSEFPSWKASAGGKVVMWEGKLERSGLRKVFSFLVLDSRGIDDAKADPEQEEANKPHYTKQYFDSLNKYLDDLKEEKGAVSFGQIGMWFDKYATKIEKMPILNVDDDMVDFGMWVAQNLRNATGSIQGANIRSAAEQAQVQPEVYGTATYGGYGPYNRYGAYGRRWQPYGGGYASARWEVSSVESQRRAIRAQEKGTGAMQAREIMANVRTETQKIRRQMTERYKIEF